MKKAVFLYDYTGIMAEPWLKAGYECWLFDGQHPTGLNRDGNLVRVGMWFYPDKADDHAFEIAETVGSCDFLFGFPDCTDLAVSGAAHFAKKRKINPRFQDEATDLAKMVETTGNILSCPWGVENPISVLSSTWRKPDYYFDPFEYGGYLPGDDRHPIWPEYIKPQDAYPKRTSVWCGNGFIMPEKRLVPVDKGFSAQFHMLGGKSRKTKNIRSATPRGFANAVFLSNGRSK